MPSALIDPSVRCLGRTR